MFEGHACHHWSKVLCHSILIVVTRYKGVFARDCILDMDRTKLCDVYIGNVFIINLMILSCIHKYISIYIHSFVVVVYCL